MMTPKQQLLELQYRGAIDHDIQTDIADAIADRMSWRDIRHMVEQRSGIQVSHESLRQWYGKVSVSDGTINP
jgi:transposase-like protein